MTTTIERHDVAMMTVYAGDHYEQNVTTGEATSYYTFAGQRVAMRSNAGVMWLHGDPTGTFRMLGSA